MEHARSAQISRRQALGSAAALAGLASRGKAASQQKERYKLGVMAGMYSMLPLDDALSRIRKAGFRYISIARRHGNEQVFSAEMPKSERKAMLRRIRDLGVEPFMTLFGFSGEPATPAGLAAFNAQLDLCADFEIPVMVGSGPWYFTRFPNIPKRHKDWVEEVDRFYAGLEKAVRHAESVRVVIALKPHTGITARAKDCLEVMRRFQSPYLKIAWDAGNVSYYEGVHPDPDLPDLAPHVTALCIKDHLGLRGENNFPVPGQGQIDHELMFRTLFAAGFHGPMGIERLDGRAEKRLAPDVVDQRLKEAHAYLVPLLDRITSGA